MNTPIRLTHRQQSTAGRCLPACAGMILDRLKIHFDEDRLVELLGTRNFGTPGFAIKRLETIGVQLNYGECNIPNLLAILDSGIPIILFVRTGFLDDWKEDVAHAVVLVEATPGELAMI